jgi:hypothetical protein
MTFGWEKYLVVLLAARLSGGLFYFVFSWGFHRRLLYRFGVVNEMPAPFFWMFRVGNGKRTGESVRYHASHHAWPGVPSRRLHEFDSAVMRNPDAALEMIPSG